MFIETSKNSIELSVIIDKTRKLIKNESYKLSISKFTINIPLSYVKHIVANPLFNLTNSFMKSPYSCKYEQNISITKNNYQFYYDYNKIINSNRSSTANRRNSFSSFLKPKKLFGTKITQTPNKSAIINSSSPFISTIPISPMSTEIVKSIDTNESGIQFDEMEMTNKKEIIIETKELNMILVDEMERNCIEISVESSTSIINLRENKPIFRVSLSQLSVYDHLNNVNIISSTSNDIKSKIKIESDIRNVELINMRIVFSLKFIQKLCEIKDTINKYISNIIIKLSNSNSAKKKSIFHIYSVFDNIINVSNVLIYVPLLDTNEKYMKVVIEKISNENKTYPKAIEMEIIINSKIDSILEREILSSRYFMELEIDKLKIEVENFILKISNSQIKFLLELINNIKYVSKSLKLTDDRRPYPKSIKEKFDLNHSLLSIVKILEPITNFTLIINKMDVAIMSNEFKEIFSLLLNNLYINLIKNYHTISLYYQIRNIDLIDKRLDLDVVSNFRYFFRFGSSTIPSLIGKLIVNQSLNIVVHLGDISFSPTSIIFVIHDWIKSSMDLFKNQSHNTILLINEDNESKYPIDVKLSYQINSINIFLTEDIQLKETQIIAVKLSLDGNINLQKDSRQIDFSCNVRNVLACIVKNDFIFPMVNDDFIIQDYEIEISYLNKELSVISHKSLEMKLMYEYMIILLNYLDNMKPYLSNNEAESNLEMIDINLKIEIEGISVFIFISINEVIYTWISLNLSKFILNPLNDHFNFSFIFYSYYYNIDISAWEPLIEHWSLNGLLNIKNKIDLSISSPQLSYLNINITPSFLKTILSSFSSTTYNRNCFTYNNSFVKIQNLTGFPFDIVKIPQNPYERLETNRFKGYDTRESIIRLLSYNKETINRYYTASFKYPDYLTIYSIENKKDIKVSGSILHYSKQNNVISFIFLNKSTVSLFFYNKAEFLNFTEVQNNRIKAATPLSPIIKPKSNTVKHNKIQNINLSSFSLLRYKSNCEDQNSIVIRFQESASNIIINPDLCGLYPSIVYINMNWYKIIIEIKIMKGGKFILVRGLHEISNCLNTSISLECYNFFYSFNNIVLKPNEKYYVPCPLTGNVHENSNMKISIESLGSITKNIGEFISEDNSYILSIEAMNSLFIENKISRISENKNEFLMKTIEIKPLVKICNSYPETIKYKIFDADKHLIFVSEIESSVIDPLYTISSLKKKFYISICVPSLTDYYSDNNTLLECNTNKYIEIIKSQTERFEISLKCESFPNGESKIYLYSDIILLNYTNIPLWSSFVNEEDEIQNSIFMKNIDVKYMEEDININNSLMKRNYSVLGNSRNQKYIKLSLENPIFNKWSSSFNSNIINIIKDISVVDNSKNSYQLCISSYVLGGAFYNSRILLIKPKYKIINLTTKEIEVRQKNCKEVYKIFPNNSIQFNLNSKFEKLIRIRMYSKKNSWNWGGSIPFNCIPTPFKINHLNGIDNKYYTIESILNKGQSILITRDMEINDSPYEIINECIQYDAIISQVNTNSNRSIVVPSLSRCGFAWSTPSKVHDIYIILFLDLSNEIQESLDLYLKKSRLLSLKVSFENIGEEKCIEHDNLKYISKLEIINNKKILRIFCEEINTIRQSLFMTGERPKLKLLENCLEEIKLIQKYSVKSQEKIHKPEFIMITLLYGIQLPINHSSYSIYVTCEEENENGFFTNQYDEENIGILRNGIIEYKNQILIYVYNNKKSKFKIFLGFGKYKIYDENTRTKEIVIPIYSNNKCAGEPTSYIKMIYSIMDYGGNNAEESILNYINENIYIKSDILIKKINREIVYQTESILKTSINANSIEIKLNKISINSKNSFYIVMKYGNTYKYSSLYEPTFIKSINISSFYMDSIDDLEVVEYQGSFYISSIKEPSLSTMDDKIVPGCQLISVNNRELKDMTLDKVLMELKRNKKCNLRIQIENYNPIEIKEKFVINSYDSNINKISISIFSTEQQKNVNSGHLINTEIINSLGRIHQDTLIGTCIVNLTKQERKGQLLEITSGSFVDISIVHKSKENKIITDFNLIIPRIGLSLINTEQEELCYVSISGIEVSSQFLKDNFFNFNLRFQSIEIDDCSANAVFPVILYPYLRGPSLDIDIEGESLYNIKQLKIFLNVFHILLLVLYTEFSLELYFKAYKFNQIFNNINFTK